MKHLALVVFPDFKDQGIQPVVHPANGQELLWNIGPAIKPVRLRKQLARFLETYATARIRSKATPLSRIEA
jgi:hypothetical protein